MPAASRGRRMALAAAHGRCPYRELRPLPSSGLLRGKRRALIFIRRRTRRGVKVGITVTAKVQPRHPAGTKAWGTRSAYASAGNLRLALAAFRSREPRPLGGRRDRSVTSRHVGRASVSRRSGRAGRPARQDRQAGEASRHRRADQRGVRAREGQAPRADVADVHARLAGASVPPRATVRTAVAARRSAERSAGRRERAGTSAASLLLARAPRAGTP